MSQTTTEIVLELYDMGIVRRKDGLSANLWWRQTCKYTVTPPVVPPSSSPPQLLNNPAKICSVPASLRDDMTGYPSRREILDAVIAADRAALGRRIRRDDKKTEAEIHDYNYHGGELE